MRPTQRQQVRRAGLAGVRHRTRFASRIFRDVPVLRNDDAACVGYRTPRRPPPSSGRQSSPAALLLDAGMLLLLLLLRLRLLAPPRWRQHVVNQPATDWAIRHGRSMMCRQQLRVLWLFSSYSPSSSLMPLEGIVCVVYV
ncbi:hypothetical protein O9K51_03870 [Purpureocillium lavendulum]|uniref:Uncharacterized protein n=1 Tax=Purpureocillium lavendulum TaxID=1247861 RepID=A0AB34FXF2_9HYPO|nr:hypothetical protein O9K51_03870 [Purpureocillium lavendulum]